MLVMRILLYRAGYPFVEHFLTGEVLLSIEKIESIFFFGKDADTNQNLQANMTSLWSE
jgi:hypothetical protein